jgi:type I restriction enzyme M protein
MSDWGGERLREDVRWKFGVPPVSNANYAWVQHMIHHLSPTGVTGFVLANGSMSSNQSGEGEIRKNIIEADLVDCRLLYLRSYFMVPLYPLFMVLDREKHPCKSRVLRGLTLL